MQKVIGKQNLSVLSQDHEYQSPGSSQDPPVIFHRAPGLDLIGFANKMRSEGSFVYKLRKEIFLFDPPPSLLTLLHVESNAKPSLFHQI